MWYSLHDINLVLLQVAALETEVSVLQRKLADLEAKEKAVIEGEHQIESLQQELVDVREELKKQEVGQ